MVVLSTNITGTRLVPCHKSDHSFSSTFKNTQNRRESPVLEWITATQSPLFIVPRITFALPEKKLFINGKLRTL